MLRSSEDLEKRFSGSRLWGRWAAIALLLALVCACSFPIDASAEETSTATLSAQTLGSLGSAATAFRQSGEQRETRFAFVAAEGPVYVTLRPHDIRANNYRNELDGPRLAPSLSVDLFEGRPETENERDFARLTLISDNDGKAVGVRGFIKLGDNYYDLRNVEQSAANLQIKSMSRQSVDALIASCGLPDELEGFHADETGRVRIASGNLMQAQIATEADYEYVQAAGSETLANADILSILNAVDAIYQTEVGVTLVVTYQHAWTVSGDPYSATDASGILSEFLNYWATNFSSSVTYDLAHMWTGKNIDGSTIGIAYLSAVCKSWAYGVSQRMNNSNQDVPLVAHELGHNFGSGHDTCGAGDNWIMCPSLHSGANDFSTSSESQITSYVGSISCLDEVETVDTTAPASPSNLRTGS